jgi:hypothetical protein
VASLLVIGLAFVSYGLWAQNRFLVWLQSHPDYVRAPGPWTERLEAANEIAFWIPMTLIFAFAVYRIRTGGGPFANGVTGAGLGRLAKWLPPQPPRSAQWLLALGILGGVGVLCGFAYLAIITETYVWEGREWSGLGTVYLLFWTSLSALQTVAQSLRRGARGSRARTLPPEDEDVIRRVVIGGEVIAAVALYRQRVAGASLAEAQEFVTRIAREFEAQHPGAISANSRARFRLSRTSIRPIRLIAGCLIESAILGVVLAWLPTADRRRCLFEFVGSQVAGAAFALVLKRVSGRPRSVISVAVSLSLLLVEIVFQSLDPENYTFGTVFFGFFAGIVVFRIMVADGSASQPATVLRQQEPSSR